MAQLVRAVEPNSADAIAQSLLRELGSIGQVLNAKRSKLARIAGSEEVAEILNASHSAVMEGLRDEVQRRRIDVRDPKLVCYLKGKLQGSDEHLHVILMDKYGRYITDERVCSGDWTSVTVNLRHLFQRLMESCAAQFILGHNHPSGDPNPSESDISFTQSVQKTAATLGIKLVDHIIVAGNYAFSMKTAGIVA